MSYERSLIGQKYLGSFRDACRVEGVTITGVEAIAQSGVDATEVVNTLHATAPKPSCTSASGSAWSG